MVHKSGSLVIELVFNKKIRVVLNASKVQRVYTTYENVAGDKLFVDEFVRQMVILGSAEVDNEKWKSVFQRESFAEVLLSFENCLDHIYSLRKSYKSVERFVLDVQKVEDKFDCLDRA